SIECVEECLSRVSSHASTVRGVMDTAAPLAEHPCHRIVTRRPRLPAVGPGTIGGRRTRPIGDTMTAAGHPQYHQPAGRPPGKRMRGVGRGRCWTGLARLLVRVAVGIIVAYMGFSRLAESAGDRQPVDGSVQVTLQQNERRLFYVPAEAHQSTGSDGET